MNTCKHDKIRGWEECESCTFEHGWRDGIEAAVECVYKRTPDTRWATDLMHAIRALAPPAPSSAATVTVESLYASYKGEPASPPTTVEPTGHASEDGKGCEHPPYARFVLASRQPLLFCNVCGYEYWGIDEGHGKGWQPERSAGTGRAR
jgi:hypothetical protein